MEEGRLVSTWEAITKDDVGEAHIHTLHKYDHTIPDNLAEIYTPAEPARITPSRRKAIKRASEKVLVFSDLQIGYRRIDELEPIHDERAIDLIHQISKDVRPDTIVNLSDTIDLGELSRFDPDSDHFHRTLAPSFQRVHDFYAQLRADNPDARIVEVDSNHTARPTRSILKKMPELYGFTLPGEDYPLMTYYSLARLAHVGVEFISGYGAAEFVYGGDYGREWIFKHGNHSSSSAGATVRKESTENPEVNVMRGHGHSMEMIQRTTRSGDQNYYVQLGATCLTSGEVPSFRSAVDDHNRPVHTQHNWQKNIAVLHDHMNGRYQLDIVDTHNGQAYYNDKEYKA